jgi:hypothetical protein
MYSAVFRCDSTITSMQNMSGTSRGSVSRTQPKLASYVLLMRRMRLASGLFDDVRCRSCGRQEAEMYSAVISFDRTIRSMYNMWRASLGSVSRTQPKLAYVLLMRRMRLSGGMFDDIRRRRGGRQKAEMYSSVFRCDRTMKGMYNMWSTSLGSVSRTQPKLASYALFMRRMRLSSGMFDDVRRRRGGRQEAEMYSAVTRYDSTIRAM